MQTKVLPFSLKASAWMLSGLGRPMPGLAARLFLRMYCTPPRRKMTGAHQAALQKAKTSSLALTSYSFDAAPLAIRTYRWGGPGKKVLVLHGWGDTGLSFGNLTGRLVAAGYEVVSYDGPAHGGSEGKRTTLIQWMHILDQVLRQERDLHAIVAHSIGALNVALTLARNAHHTIPALVLAAPSLSAPGFFQETFDLFGIKQEVQNRTYELIRARFREDLTVLDLHRYIGGIRADRILLIYDENDQLIKYREIEEYLQRYPAIEPHRIKGDGHFRILKNQQVVDKVVDWLSLSMPDGMDRQPLFTEVAEKK